MDQLYSTELWGSIGTNWSIPFANRCRLVSTGTDFVGNSVSIGGTSVSLCSIVTP
ncbi:hypothetical protein [Enterococcus sp. 5H]|uniref:hypothetical protein n=1 Tax=Enterococcus sp. 5H TaxID=1229490 RepID=UPI0023045830|nr:hypothetical protein [Enterococcus sp. 5H]